MVLELSYYSQRGIARVPSILHNPSACELSNADAYSYSRSRARIKSDPTLQPNPSGDAPWVGNLTVESIDSSIDGYDAISYIWGDPARSYSLQSLAVSPSFLLSPSGPCIQPLTRSIYDTLRRLGIFNQARRLPADQVCINQDDVAERSRQVRLMNRIYKGASDALVWLGPDNEGVAPAAVKMVKELEEIFGDEEKLEGFRRDHLEELAERPSEAWDPLFKLTKLPWLNRI